MPTGAVIGGTVFGGTEGRLLYVGSGLLLAGSDNLFWDEDASQLELKGASGPQLQIGYDGTNYAEFEVDSLHYFTMTINGTRAARMDTTPLVDGNTSFGFSALSHFVSAPPAIGGNAAFGYRTLEANTIGIQNTGLGLESLFNNVDGSNNTGCGFETLYSNVDGDGNTAAGWRALYLNVNSSENCAFGLESLYASNGGTANCSFGFQASRATTSGSGNCGFGYQSLALNQTGSSLVAVGYFALKSSVTADFSVAVGRSALESATGGNHTAVGNQAGYSMTSGTGGVFIGFKAGYNETASNKLYISNSDTTSPLIYGDFSTPALTFNGDVKITAKVGFYNTTPISQQTGVAVTATGVHNALVNLGLITA